MATEQSVAFIGDIIPFGLNTILYKKEMFYMGLLEDLKALDVNVDEGLERMMGNSSLYERMLVKFIKVMNDLEVTPDLIIMIMLKL